MIEVQYKWKTIATVPEDSSKYYLSEINKLSGELPQGVFNKGKADAGGTFLALSCSYNYIIVVPTVALVLSITKDEHNTNEVFACYGDEGDKNGWDTYHQRMIRENKPLKIAVTYDSFPKIKNWISPNFKDFRVLIDEYHMLVTEVGYRKKAIQNLLQNIKKDFGYVTYLSATPVPFEYNITKVLPHKQIVWKNKQLPKPIIHETDKPFAATILLIERLLRGNLYLNDCNGVRTKVEKLYIFFNSVSCIQKLIKALITRKSKRENMTDSSDFLDNFKIVCADTERNKVTLDDYPNCIAEKDQPIHINDKKINLYTKKAYQGCNLFTDNGLVVIVSEAFNATTAPDIATEVVQITGRIRYDKNNPEHQNCFRNTFVHIVDERYKEVGITKLDLNKEQERARELKDAWNSMNDDARKTFKEFINMDKLNQYDLPWVDFDYREGKDQTKMIIDGYKRTYYQFRVSAENEYAADIQNAYNNHGFNPSNDSSMLFNREAEQFVNVFYKSDVPNDAQLFFLYKESRDTLQAIEQKGWQEEVDPEILHKLLEDNAKFDREHPDFKLICDLQDWGWPIDAKDIEHLDMDRIQRQAEICKEMPDMIDSIYHFRELDVNTRKLISNGEFRNNMIEQYQKHHFSQEDVTIMQETLLRALCTQYPNYTYTRNSHGGGGGYYIRRNK